MTGPHRGAGVTGRMRVRLVAGPFGPEWVVTCPEHGAVAWVQDIWDTDHTAAMNHAVWHVRNEHVKEARP